MKKLVFATNNPHKLQELRQILSEEQIEILSLKDINYSKDIPETSDTLEGNALIKARTIHQAFGIDTLADDTGLLVDALNGEPGVRSARYSGEGADAESNINLLLHKLEGETNRKAHFKTVFALIYKGNEYCVEGKVYGSIATERLGAKGFGYDPIFVPDGFDSSFAQMSGSEKNAISHRGRAAREFLALLTKLVYNEN